jgi:hypothetical protein
MNHSRNILLTSGILLVMIVVVLSARISAPTTFITSSATVGAESVVSDSGRPLLDGISREFQVSKDSPGGIPTNRKPAAQILTGERVVASRYEKSNRSIHSNSGMKVFQRAAGEYSVGFLEAAASREEAWYPANPRLIGNSLSHAGQRAEIQQYQPSPGSVGVGLALSVGTHSEAEIQTLPVDQAGITHDKPYVVGTAGFTYEQELFRTKWGWAAYDQVQKVLREETSD